MIQAVIFDVDGTMVDSRNANLAFYRAIMERAGYPPPTREDILECFHVPLWQTLEKLIGATDQAEIERVWKLAHDPALRSPHLLGFPPRFEEILETLAKEYRLAIVTGRTKAGVTDIFKARPIEHLFEAVVTYEDYLNPKPDPEPLLIALRRLEVGPHEAIYVGDSWVDIEAARAAGMRSIHLADATDPRADLGIMEFQELIKALQSLRLPPRP